MSREPVGWVFNLDAEDELRRGGPHTPTQVTRARVEGLLPLLGPLMQPQDEVVWPSARQTFHARWGRTWCPTRWALEQLSRAGLRVPPAPSPAVLREVNHRRFAHGLGQALPGARFVQNERELLEALCDSRLLARVSSERNWLMKRPLGYAGRGRRKISSGELNRTDRVWIDAALRSGDGLQVEPLVARELDCGLHGWLGADGQLSLGQPTRQQIDASGQWLSTERAAPTALEPTEREQLQREATATAQALRRAGYFGPFGLDAFRWRAPDGSVHFQPRFELNARYSMVWAIGMGEFEV
ncbi:MAG: uncharacterized protein H6Q89_1194, partial [Myxococcaceae bacterium]|nr:uncharacterized protein [Myxococcaceae bacterium]